MNLEIDIGNTRFKWRLKDNKRIMSRGSIANIDICDESSFAEAFASIDQYRPSRIYVASVYNKNSACFSAWCQKKWSLVPLFLKVSEIELGVTNAYLHVEQMGVDRWLAMLAAYSWADQQACLIVDCGSACTVDLILANGTHLGGYIVPGAQLMKSALFRGTDRVKPSQVSYDAELRPGKTTQEAVSGGLWIMQLGLVQSALQQLLDAGAVMPCVVFTGGAGEYLARFFCAARATGAVGEPISKVEFKVDLVFDGMSLMLEQY
jgi:type III pantothenate kinase